MPLDVSVGAIATVAAGVAGFVAVDSPSAFRLLVVIPFAFWLLANRLAAASLMAFTLPYVADISGGATGLNVTLSDILMTVFVGTLFLQWLLTQRAAELATLAPLKVVVGQYLVVILVLLAAHFGLMELIKTLQRMEIFIFPIIVGAALVYVGKELWVLRAYILGTAVTAALWIGGIQLGQKNPTGQFIANSLLLLMASKELRRRLIWLSPLLAAGLLWTQSRGAILSVGIGLVVLMLTQPGRRRIRSLLQLLPLAVMAFAVWQFLPEKAQARNLSYTSSDESAAAWAIKIREIYQQDAWNVIHANPGTGIGVGQYLTGSAYQGTITTDPHEVLLQQAAEGGYLFAVSFAILIVGTAIVVWRYAGSTPLGPIGVALTLAITGHGLVDVYWVRGTPVMGWLLVGMALAQGRLKVRAPAPQRSDLALAEP